MVEGDNFFVAGASKADDLALYLLKFPGEIRKAEQAVLNLTEVAELAHADVKEHDVKFMAQINNNPALRNDGQRKTELEAMRNASEEYNNALIEKITSDKNLAVAWIDLGFNLNIFKAYLAIVGGNRL